MQFTPTLLRSAHLNNRFQQAGGPGYQASATEQSAPQESQLQTSDEPSPSPAPASPDIPPGLNIPQDAIDRFTSAAANSLNVGNKAVIEIKGRQPIEVEGQKPLLGPKWAEGAKELATKAAHEAAVAINSGPNLTIDVATAAIKPLVLRGVSEGVGNYVNQWSGPLVRAANVAISVNSFVEGIKRQHQAGIEQLPKTPLDGINTAVEGAHILTSAAGLAGSLGAALKPSLAHLGAVGEAVAIGGDVVEFAVNELHYILLRDELAHAGEQASKKS